MKNYRNFETWCADNGIEYPKTESINASWFQEHGLPMIVGCRCCCSTMALPNGFIDDDDYVYCRECAGIDD